MIYPDDIFVRTEKTTRFAFAKMYEEMRRGDQLAAANAVLVDRIETLVPVCLQLVQDVLYERNPQAFATAWRVDQMVRDYCRGARRDAPPEE